MLHRKKDEWVPSSFPGQEIEETNLSPVGSEFGRNVWKRLARILISKFLVFFYLFVCERFSHLQTTWAIFKVRIYNILIHIHVYTCILQLYNLSYNYRVMRCLTNVDCIRLGLNWLHYIRLVRYNWSKITRLSVAEGGSWRQLAKWQLVLQYCRRWTKFVGVLPETNVRTSNKNTNILITKKRKLMVNS